MKTVHIHLARSSGRLVAKDKISQQEEEAYHAFKRELTAAAVALSKAKGENRVGAHNKAQVSLLQKKFSELIEKEKRQYPPGWWEKK